MIIVDYLMNNLNAEKEIRACANVHVTANVQFSFKCHAVHNKFYDWIFQCYICLCVDNMAINNDFDSIINGTR